MIKTQMKRLITIDDIVDLFHKLRQRGTGFILSKFHLKGIKRTKKTFSQSEYKSSDWWIIPKIKQRWNKLITGDNVKSYESYLAENFLKGKNNLKLISLGSGTCSHEIELAKYSIFHEIICVDISERRLQEAENKAKHLNLKNIKFVCADVNKYNLKNEYFDIVFFHQSLHHFDNLNFFIRDKISGYLKKNGLLVINEYVGANRLQFSKFQIEKINEALKIIPKKYRFRHKSNLLKKNFHGPGILRMIIADPSECIDSESILPTIHNTFHPIIEKPYGGNILMNVLKDISHHFLEIDQERDKILEELFLFEDEYLIDNPSDFIFGIYRKLPLT